MYLYDHTPFCIKKANNGAISRKRNVAIGFKLWLQARLHSANNMGSVPSGHTSSSVCKAEMSKMVILNLKNQLDLITCSLLF